MWPKIHSSEKCPQCGRVKSSERVRRPRWVRLFFSGTQMMKCRLCLCRYLVKN